MQYPSYTEELYYDRAGNRTRRTAKGVEELYKYDPRNRLTEYTKGGVTTQFTYDNAGNLLKDDKAKYTYDAFNRTEKVETFDGHVQINRYDAEGLRHEMEEDGRLVQFIFRGDEVIAEEKDSSTIRYIRGYDLIASDAESARTYYHYASDEMSSITHIVGEDQVLNHYEYDAWGNTTICEETVENRFRFNGQQYDAITQQYYLRARFYNPVIARFTQEDTYRGDGLNLYAYCANNPVYYVDPSGHMPDCMKEVYDKALAEGKSKAEAYKLAKEAYWEGQARARQQAEQAALAEAGMNMGENRPDMPQADIPDNGNRYPQRTELAQEECQRVVNIGNALKAFDNTLKSKIKGKPTNPVTCVFVHENGDVSVGISGQFDGNQNNNNYAMKLQAALNESAGRNKYTVSAVTAPELMAKMPERIDGGNPPGVCAEPKAATAAHSNNSPIVGMDVRYFTTENVPHGYNGTNQMEQCNTCAFYEKEIMGYANANKNF